MMLSQSKMVRLLWPRQRRSDVRRHATLPQSWIQRENWEFETYRRLTVDSGSKPDSRPFRWRATKAWIAQAAIYRQVRHWGKFRRAVMLGSVVFKRKGRTAVCAAFVWHNIKDGYDEYVD